MKFRSINRGTIGSKSAEGGCPRRLRKTSKRTTATTNDDDDDDYDEDEEGSARTRAIDNRKVLYEISGRITRPSVAKGPFMRSGYVHSVVRARWRPSTLVLSAIPPSLGRA